MCNSDHPRAILCALASLLFSSVATAAPRSPTGGVVVLGVEVKDKLDVASTTDLARRLQRLGEAARSGRPDRLVDWTCDQDCLRKNAIDQHADRAVQATVQETDPENHNYLLTIRIWDMQTSKMVQREKNCDGCDVSTRGDLLADEVAEVLAELEPKIPVPRRPVLPPPPPLEEPVKIASVSAPPKDDLPEPVIVKPAEKPRWMPEEPPRHPDRDEVVPRLTPPGNFRLEYKVAVGMSALSGALLIVAGASYFATHHEALQSTSTCGIVVDCNSRVDTLETLRRLPLIANGAVGLLGAIPWIIGHVNGKRDSRLRVVSLGTSFALQGSF